MEKTKEIKTAPENFASFTPKSKSDKRNKTVASQKTEK